MSDTTPTTDDATESEHSVHVPDADDMDDAEFWQRLALEATVNDDPAMAFAMRTESFFDDVWAFPSDGDTCVVDGLSFRSLDEWLMNTDFDYETREAADDADAIVVEGLAYEPKWLRDFDG